MTAIAQILVKLDHRRFRVFIRKITIKSKLKRKKYYFFRDNLNLWAKWGSPSWWSISPLTLSHIAFPNDFIDLPHIVFPHTLLISLLPRDFFDLPSHSFAKEISISPRSFCLRNFIDFPPHQFYWFTLIVSPPPKPELQIQGSSANRVNNDFINNDNQARLGDKLADSRRFNWGELIHEYGTTIMLQIFVPYNVPYNI